MHSRARASSVRLRARTRAHTHTHTGTLTHTHTARVDGEMLRTRDHVPPRVAASRAHLAHRSRAAGPVPHDPAAAASGGGRGRARAAEAEDVAGRHGADACAQCAGRPLPFPCARMRGKERGNSEGKAVCKAERRREYTHARVAVLRRAIDIFASAPSSAALRIDGGHDRSAADVQPQECAAYV